MIIKMRNTILIRSLQPKFLTIIYLITLLINPFYSLASEEKWKSDPEEFINFFSSKGITEILTSNDTEEIKAKELKLNKDTEIILSSTNFAYIEKAKN